MSEQAPEISEPIAETDISHAVTRRGRPIRLRRVRAWLRLWRIRFARIVLLPELSPNEAFALRKSVHEDSELTRGYVLMCALSAGIATLGLLQSSTAVVIGAMLISPLMNPIAALGFGFASVDGSRIRDAVRVVAAGAAIGIATGMILTWLSPIRNATPEILARTEPTLLDLAVALFSGLAGGYAIVIGKGGAAIGVAIATALMPPLATLGYGLGVLQLRFAAGAFLLFLTNLAAIAFAFALVARLSGAARPLYKVEWTPRHTAILIGAFLALATPLSMTLLRITHEASMRSAARSAILASTSGADARIAQIDVSTPLFGDPQIDAVVITSEYATNAQKDAEERLEREMGEKVTIRLQQVVAADLQTRTRAMINAAMERTVAGLAADVPPIDRIRNSIGLPTRGFWTNRAEKMVYVEPVPAPGWTLEDYRMAESQANRADEIWTVRIIPPASPQLRVRLDGPAARGNETSETSAADETSAAAPAPSISADLAIWTLLRWGMAKVVLSAPEGSAAQPLRKALVDAGIVFLPAEGPPPEEEGIALIGVYRPGPATLAAAEAKAKAEREAKAKAEAAAQASAPPPSTGQ